MKISMNWIGKYVNLEGVDLDELSNRFTLSVAEIDEVIKVKIMGEKLYLGEVIEVEPHPGADKLRLATVNLGDRTQKVVCGAPNLTKGMFSILADTDATVLDPKGQEFTLKKTKIRGVESSGMLVSPSEIGLAPDHSGIIELTGEAKPGTPLEQLIDLEDTIWDIDNKSLTHRPDLWGHMGIAREIASLLSRPLELKLEKPDYSSEDPLKVNVAVPVLCPRYTAVTISDIAIKPSPFWMQVLLYNAEQRPINNIVDFTNFVMLATGNPLHAFDINFIKDNTIKIRRAEPEEEITTLDGETHKLIGDDLVIADGEKAIALAGVMGGQNSEVLDTTTQIVLESANFKAASIRKTAARHGIRTESSARFEKSLDPDFARQANWLFCQLVKDTIKDSKINSRFYDLDSSNKEEISIEISCDFIRQKLGTSLTDKKIISILTSLDFKVQTKEGNLTVKVPSYRATKDIAIPEDLVEEIGRIFGYDNIEPKLPLVSLNKPFTLPHKILQNQIRNQLSIGLGFNEIMTYSFVAENTLQKIGEDPSQRLALANPISKEEPVLRKDLVPNILETILKNERNEEDIRIYELGRVFHENSQAPIPNQPLMAGIVLAENSSDNDADQLFFKMKYVVKQLFGRLERGKISLQKNTKFSLPWIHKAKSAQLELQNQTIGYLTSLNPYTAKEMEIQSNVVLALLNVDKIANLEKDIPLFDPLPKYPGINHDVSIIIDNKVSAAEVEEVLWQVEPELTKSIECFDVYSSDDMENKRSLSFRILFSHPEKTLKQKKIKKIHKKIVKTVKDKTGGTILS